MWSRLRPGPGGPLNLGDFLFFIISLASRHWTSVKITFTHEISGSNYARTQNANITRTGTWWPLSILVKVLLMIKACVAVSAYQVSNVCLGPMSAHWPGSVSWLAGSDSGHTGAGGGGLYCTVHCTPGDHCTAVLCTHPAFLPDPSSPLSSQVCNAENFWLINIRSITMICWLMTWLKNIDLTVKEVKMEHWTPIDNACIVCPVSTQSECLSETKEVVWSLIHKIFVERD